MHGAERHRTAKRQRRQDRQLMGGIDAIDVEARIRLGVAQRSRITVRM
jgi:hypothetical protein